MKKFFQPKKLKKIIGVFNTYPLENQVKGVVPNIWTEKERQRREAEKRGREEGERLDLLSQ